MTIAVRYGFVGVGALGLLTAAQWARGNFTVDPPLLGYSLGVLPSFAAAIAIPFVAMAIWADHAKPEVSSAHRRFFVRCLAISTLGLMAWELIQPVSVRLFFDPHDIAATVLGALTAIGLFRVAAPQDGVSGVGGCPPDGDDRTRE